MKRSRFSEEVACALRQAESGTPVGDVRRQLGVSEGTLYVWKKCYDHLGVNEVRRVLTGRPLWISSPFRLAR
jgi:putative transposase